MLKVFLILELIIFGIFSSKSIEDKKNNKSLLGCCKDLDNFVGDNLDVKKNNVINGNENKITYYNLFTKISATIKHIDNFKEGFKIIFNIIDEDKDKLLGIDIKNITISVENNVFITWKDGNDINDGMSLSEIKKNFLKYNRFYPDSDPFSFSIKLKKGFDINKKIKISLNFNFKNIENNENKDNTVTIPVKNLKGEEEFSLFSLIYNDFEKYNELYEIIKNNCFCTSVYNIENSIKLVFPENDKLLNNNFRDLLTIVIEDENGIEIKDNVLLKWVSKENIKNNSFLYDIKKSFLKYYNNNRYETEQKPYQISMFFDKSKYKKIKIKIKYTENDFFYIKNNNSEIIDLEHLEKPVYNGKNNENNNKFNENKNIKVSKDKLSEEQFKEKLKNLFNNGITCEKVGNFKNSFKIKFKVDEDLIGESYRNNIKIQYFDKNDKLLDECLFSKWAKDVNIENNTKLSSIKSGFLYMFPQYKVETYKLFEISMHINKNIKEKNVKIKISYNDEFSEFVKSKGSELINLDDFK